MTTITNDGMDWDRHYKIMDMRESEIEMKTNNNFHAQCLDPLKAIKSHMDNGNGLMASVAYNTLIRRLKALGYPVE